MSNVWRDAIEDLVDRPVFGAGREELPMASISLGLDDDSATSAERVPVELAGGVWIRVDKAGKVHAGPMAPKKTRGVVAPRSSDHSTRWLGFALIGRGPHDIRPDLLALVWQRNLIGVERCIRYGANYLRASGHDHDMDLLQCVAADALLILTYGETRGDGTGRKRSDGSYTAGGQIRRHRPKRPTLHQRERQFIKANGGWGTMRKAVLKAYRRRYREAVALFAEVYNWRPLSNGRSYASGFKPDPLHRDQWMESRRVLADRIEASRSGLLISADCYNDVWKGFNRHCELAPRRRAA